MTAPPPTFSTNANAASKSDDLKSQFMTLLTEQVKNQDPTDPLKPREQIAQLAQLSSLEQAQKQSQTLASILNKLPTTRTESSSPIDLIGHKVEFNLKSFMIQNDTDVDFKIDQSQITNDTDITVLIKDKSGKNLSDFIVHKNDFDDSLSWDGKDYRGNYIGYKPVSMIATQSSKVGDIEIPIVASSTIKSFNYHNKTSLKMDDDITINSNSIINVY